MVGERLTGHYFGRVSASQFYSQLGSTWNELSYTRHGDHEVACGMPPACGPGPASSKRRAVPTNHRSYPAARDHTDAQTDVGERKNLDLFFQTAATSRSCATSTSPYYSPGSDSHGTGDLSKQRVNAKAATKNGGL